jgi:hypothetical protein
MYNGDQGAYMQDLDKKIAKNFDFSLIDIRLKTVLNDIKNKNENEIIDILGNELSFINKQKINLNDKNKILDLYKDALKDIINIEILSKIFSNTAQRNTYPRTSKDANLRDFWFKEQIILANNDKKAIDLLILNEKNHIENCNLSLATKRNYLTIYRKTLKDIIDKNQFLSLGINKRLNALINEKTDIFVNNVNDNMRAVPYVFIESLIDKLLNSKNTISQLAGVMLATGRRPYEIIKLGNFTLPKNKFKRLHFTGQAKAKGIEKKPYDFLILGNVAPKKIIEIIDSIRATFSKDATLKEINTSTAYLLNDLIKNIFKTIPSIENYGIKAYDLRKIYINIAYYLDKEEGFKANKTLNKYASMKLGHEDNDLKTAITYTVFSIDFENSNIDIENFNTKIDNILNDFMKKNKRNLSKDVKLFKNISNQDYIEFLKNNGKQAINLVDLAIDILKKNPKIHNLKQELRDVYKHNHDNKRPNELTLNKVVNLFEIKTI